MYLYVFIMYNLYSVIKIQSNPTKQPLHHSPSNTVLAIKKGNKYWQASAYNINQHHTTTGGTSAPTEASDTQSVFCWTCRGLSCKICELDSWRQGVQLTMDDHGRLAAEKCRSATAKLGNCDKWLNSPSGHWRRTSAKPRSTPCLAWWWSRCIRSDPSPKLR